MDNKKILRKEKQKRKRKKQENKDFMAGLLRDSFGEFEKDENICAYCYQSIVNYYESTFDGITTMCQICYIRELNFVRKAKIQLVAKARSSDWSFWKENVLAWSSGQ